MKHKVSELEGQLLDAAVALIEGDRAKPTRFTDSNGKVLFEWAFSPSTNWLHGGPIIERKRIPNDGDLAAAMRAYVASTFGEEIEL